MELFNLTLPTVQIVTEHQPLKDFILCWRLVQWLKQDFAQDTILPIAQHTHVFLNSLKEEEKNTIRQFLEDHINALGAEKPWGYLSRIYLDSPECNCLSPDVLDDITLSHQFIGLVCTSDLFCDNFVPTLIL